MSFLLVDVLHLGSLVCLANTVPLNVFRHSDSFLEGPLLMESQLFIVHAALNS